MTVEEGSGEMVTIDLKPGGASIAVTEGNKKEYVDLMVEYRISKRVKDQFDAFMSGFSELIPRYLINVFDERELGWVIGGISEIDVYAFSFLFSLFLIGVLIFDGRDDCTKFTKYPGRGYEVNDGFENVYAHGRRSGLRSYFSSRKVFRAFLSMVSGNCMAPTDHGASGLHKLGVQTKPLQSNSEITL